ncbi:UNKNOWN [Stylonychia lemnae]|uniref:Uncharacterized protein n=1 Tax=Stylonychia lemnae TaxID=5949 RepID=A0A078ATK8_STYLE|nr:UNKNOWN [Stylonychia lemnae]|eukprot:CDW84537.1 UNKNOWN [Stylonychia lemnae]
MSGRQLPNPILGTGLNTYQTRSPSVSHSNIFQSPGEIRAESKAYQLPSNLSKNTYQINQTGSEYQNNQMLIPNSNMASMLPNISQNPYQIPQNQYLIQQQVNNPLLGGAVGVGSRRVDLMNQRKKERLRNDMISQLGQQYSQQIDSIVNQFADQEIQTLKPYEEILKSIIGRIQYQNQPQTLKPIDTSFEYKHQNQKNNINKSFMEVPQYKPLTDVNKILLMVHFYKENLQSRDPCLLDQKNVKSLYKANKHIEIFNEWAAVIQQQDKIEEQKIAQDQMRHKIRQFQYKMELDQQNAMHSQLKKNNQTYKVQTEQEMLDYLSKRDEAKQLEEEGKRQKAKLYVQEGIHFSLDQKRKSEFQQREKLRQDSDNYRDQILRQQQEQRERQINEKLQRQNEQLQYQQELQNQEQMKKQTHIMQKLEDQKLTQDYKNKLEQEEQNRQQYFVNLHRFQDKNDQKLKALNNYLSEDLHQLAKKDEQIYLKAMQDKLQKDQLMDEERQRVLAKSKQQNIQGLNSQLQEKQMQKNIQQLENVKYGEEVKNQLMNQQQLEQKHQEEQKLKQREYLNQLGQQLEETRTKRKYGALMTEHERRVNDKQIKAYENMETRNTDANLRPYDQQVQEKYLNKLFQNQTMMPYALDTSQNGQDQKVYFNNQLNSSTVVGLNQNISRKNHVNKSTLQIGAESQLGSINTSIDGNMLEQVKRNMERPEALRFRNNTGNKAYGFDQTISKQQVKLSSNLLQSSQSQNSQC